MLIDVGGEAVYGTPPNRGEIEQIPFAGGHPTLLTAHADSPSWNR